MKMWFGKYRWKNCPGVIMEMFYSAASNYNLWFICPAEKWIAKLLKNHRLLIILDDLRENALKRSSRPAATQTLLRIGHQPLQDIASIPQPFRWMWWWDAGSELFSAVLGTDAVMSEREILIKLAHAVIQSAGSGNAAHRIRQLKDFDNPVKLYLAKAENALKNCMRKATLAGIWLPSLTWVTSIWTSRPFAIHQWRFHNKGFSPNAAAYLLGLEQTESNKIINRFVNLSLLKTVPGSIERYGLHDLLDEYAALKLSRWGGGSSTRHHRRVVIGLFDEHFTEDQTTEPEVLLNGNLEGQWMVGFTKIWAGLANITRAARNWFVFLEFLTMGQWSELSLRLDEDQRLKPTCYKRLVTYSNSVMIETQHWKLQRSSETLQSRRSKLGEATCYKRLVTYSNSVKKQTQPRKLQRSSETLQAVGAKWANQRATSDWWRTAIP